MTKGDSAVTALSGVLSPLKTCATQPYFLWVTGDSTFQQAHIENREREEIAEVCPQNGVTCHPNRRVLHLDGKKLGDSTRRIAVTRAVTRGIEVLAWR